MKKVFSSPNGRAAFFRKESARRWPYCAQDVVTQHSERQMDCSFFTLRIEMRRDFVVDACSFKKAYEELVEGGVGDCIGAFQGLLDNEVVILDERGLIRHEWTVTCCGSDDEFLRQWLNNRIIDDQIQERASRASLQLRTRLRDFGVPQRDQKYIFLAESNHAFGIITEDIDFYDPKEKLTGEARKNDLKLAGRGRVCLFLRRTHNILVFPLKRTAELI
jgi:hypothetical protein